MMREIKFRAFLKTNKIVEKKYVKKDVLTLIEVEKGLYDVVALDFQDKEAKLYDWDKQVEFKVSFSEIELLQYTGLQDKNGKEIYDGYIVRDKYGVKIPMVVTWDDVGFRTLGKHNGEQYVGYVKDFCEVIGNIYENPELLQ